MGKVVQKKDKNQEMHDGNKNIKSMQNSDKAIQKRNLAIIYG